MAEEQLRKLATPGYGGATPFSQSGASDLIASLEKKNATKKYRQDIAENGRINVQKFINLHWSQSVISCQKH